MLYRLLLALALAAGVSSAAQAQVAQVIPTCGTLGAPLPLGPGGRLYTDQNGTLCTTAGSGGGGSGGSVTQGTTPWVISGNSTANGSGNPIFTQVTNFPASQAVTNAGAFAVQNTAAIPAGTNNIGSLTNITGTITLPTGAATAANQTSEITQLTAANQRSSFASDFTSFSVGASATAVGPTKSLGTSPSQWAWISFNGSATVTGGTFYLQCSTDSAFATSAATVATAAVGTASPTPGTSTTFPVSMADRVRYPFCRVVYQNGATAGNITGATALTTN